MTRHEPVLLKETLEGLNLRAGAVAIDCTLGDAGHSEAILNSIGPKGRLLGIDADAEAILRGKRFLYNFENQTVLVRGNFAELEKIAAENSFVPADAIVMDLGWSTPQFEERGRGFSFQKDEPLDMRYDAGSDKQTAKEILQNYSKEELIEIFKEYGEEQLSREIAGDICDYRNNKAIETSGELAEIILKAYRKKLNTDKEIPWIGGLHPATKVFQALRIEVNGELQALKSVLPQAIKILGKGGRLAVITFHSLEDRIVKRYFQSPANKEFALVNKKPVTAGTEELNVNPKARSAKLRIIEKK
jgi:16S rRNA (cytosine1402-N4)-methyltransferase